MSEKYFLGCMTHQGFSTEFGRLMEEKDSFTYILKGGAGTGKSSLMKRIANEFEKSGHVVRFYCSSDPESLDAVLIEEMGVLIVDGTSPHVFDPVYPAVSQRIVDLGQFWDTEKLMMNKDDIIEVTDKNKSLLARAKRFTTALSNVCGDSFSCSRGCIDEEKLDALNTSSIAEVSKQLTVAIENASASNPLEMNAAAKLLYSMGQKQEAADVLVTLTKAVPDYKRDIAGSKSKGLTNKS